LRTAICAGIVTGRNLNSEGGHYVYLGSTEDIWKCIAQQVNK